MSDFQKYLDEAFSKINTSDFSDSEHELFFLTILFIIFQIIFLSLFKSFFLIIFVCFFSYF